LVTECKDSASRAQKQIYLHFVGALPIFVLRGPKIRNELQKPRFIAPQAVFSIIVCSIDPLKAAALRENVAQTIGTPFEWLAVDNRASGRGICAVYNDCARRARYDLLCFVHEDVRFLTPQWGRILAEELVRDRCGVVGFAGGTLKTQNVTGWCLDERHARTHYDRPAAGGRTIRCRNNPLHESFSRVVCLDGFCLLTRRDVWAAAPFDERRFTGFHAYDLDFTLAVARHHENRVCHTVDIEHASSGAYSPAWRHALETCHAKWREHLPLFAGPAPDAGRIAAFERRAEALWWRKLMRLHLCTRREAKRHVLRFFVRNPLRIDAWILGYKWIKYHFK